MKRTLILIYIITLLFTIPAFADTVDAEKQIKIHLNDDNKANVEIIGVDKKQYSDLQKSFDIEYLMSRDRVMITGKNKGLAYLLHHAGMINESTIGNGSRLFKLMRDELNGEVIIKSELGNLHFLDLLISDNGVNYHAEPGFPLFHTKLNGEYSIPLRYLFEYYEFNVDYDSQDKIITIKAKEMTK